MALFLLSLIFPAFRILFSEHFHINIHHLADGLKLLDMVTVNGMVMICIEIIQEYIKAGINDYFAKPFKKQQLADILAKWQKLPQSGTDGLWQGPQ